MPDQPTPTAIALITGKPLDFLGAEVPADVQARLRDMPRFDLVKSAAVTARLYVVAALDEVATAMAKTRANYVRELRTDDPFRSLIAATEHTRRTEPEGAQP
jgi:hypothetical protein